MKWACFQLNTLAIHSPSFRPISNSATSASSEALLVIRVQRRRQLAEFIQLVGELQLKILKGVKLAAFLRGLAPLAQVTLQHSRKVSAADETRRSQTGQLTHREADKLHLPNCTDEPEPDVGVLGSIDAVVAAHHDVHLYQQQRL